MGVYRSYDGNGNSKIFLENFLKNSFSQKILLVSVSMGVCRNDLTKEKNSKFFKVFSDSDRFKLEVF